MMNPQTKRPTSWLRQLWQSEPMLTGTAVAMLGVLVIALAGLWLDPRTITGAPAWLKPAKFAISTAIYALTLAWSFQFIPSWTRTRRVVGRTTSAMFVLEVAIIAAQAWRGTTSHFNVSTPLNSTLWAVMGTGIMVQTLAATAVAVAFWRESFPDRALGWALRFGFTIAIVGALAGGLMTRPTTAQIAEARVTHRMAIAGAHTIGAPDGGPGLPGTGWSVQHGDLRVPHFAALHAFQLLPILAVVTRRRVGAGARERLLVVAGVSYAALWILLLWQALRGAPLIGGDALTLGALAGWAVLSTAAVLWRAGRTRRPDASAAVFV